MNRIQGNLIAKGLKVGIAAARFNEFIVSKLISGAEDGLLRHGAKPEDIDLVWVPGAFELPMAAKIMAEKGDYDAVICLGTVIRGSTSHYELVCAETAKGIAAAGMSGKVPVIFGVLTTETIEQAIERAGTKSGNKGFDAAMSAIEMANLMKIL